jgi:hypothetical protein
MTDAERLERAVRVTSKWNVACIVYDASVRRRPPPLPFGAPTAH